MLLMFSSCYGQTYFISLYSAEIRQEFGLTHGDFGLYYFLGTLASGFTLAWVGRFIDTMGLRRFTLANIGGLAFASIAMALTPAAFAIPAIIFLLRLFGQGLMPLASVTAMSRYFARDRGKALSISTLGLPISEAILPIVVVLVIAMLSAVGVFASKSASLALAAALRMHTRAHDHNAHHKWVGHDDDLQPSSPMQTWRKAQNAHANQHSN